MIDADPQGSLTASLGYVEPDDIGTTLATIAVREEKEHSAVEKVKFAYSEKYDPMLMHDSKHSKAEQKETSRQLGTIKFQRECIWNDVLPFQKTIC